MASALIRRLAMSAYTPTVRAISSGNRATPPLNEALRNFPKVRLISENGQDCGIMSGEQALQQAQFIGRDVMQVSAPQSTSPAVVRIVDFAALEDTRRKNAYDRRKSEKESRKLQRRESALKQVRLSPATDVNDLAVKIRQAKQFLTAGYRVRVFMMFRRGHGPLHETAKKTLIDIAIELTEFGQVQGMPRGGTPYDLFTRPRSSEDSVDSPEGSTDGVGEGEAVVKKVPLEILVYPLPRKERALLSASDSNSP